MFKNLWNFFFGRASAIDENLKTIIENGALLVDVRNDFEYSQGSATGAINLPLGTLEQAIPTLKNQNKHIVVFCKSGARSGLAKNMLKANGITNVTNGGSWQNVKAHLNV